jgi:hypothetical protein
MLRFIRNMLQLVLAPAKGWEDVAALNDSPTKLLEKGLYPLFAITAITAFAHGFYGSEPFDIGKQIEIALTQFLALFLGVMFGRATFEALIHHFTGQQTEVSRVSTVVIYSIGLMGLIQIISNLCPIQLTVLMFLPAFVAMVVWQSRIYLSVKTEHGGMFLCFGIAVLILAPIIFKELLELLIV